MKDINPPPPTEEVSSTRTLLETSFNSLEVVESYSLGAGRRQTELEHPHVSLYQLQFAVSVSQIVLGGGVALLLKMSDSTLCSQELCAVSVSST